MKGLFNWLANWWNNQKWVIEVWLFPYIDSFVVPKIAELINNNKKEIIKLLENFQADKVAEKIGTWFKDVLRDLLKLEKVK